MVAALEAGAAPEQRAFAVGRPLQDTRLHSYDGDRAACVHNERIPVEGVRAVDTCPCHRVIARPRLAPAKRALKAGPKEVYAM